MREVTVAAVQMACAREREANIEAAEERVRKAAALGADIVLLPELFEGPYFCKDRDPAHFERALPRAGHPMLRTMADLARELGVVLPVSFFERAGNAYFNSLVMIDADGTELGIYRKSHIPDGPGYQEKFYFSPGDTGFRVWRTRFGTIGTAICWDQWFPEAARAMALAGAEIIVHPTAIGSEPPDPEWDSSKHWRRVMQGHAAANLVPVVACNRIGVEDGSSCSITFYGSSFVAGPTGDIVDEAARDSDDIVTASFDLDAVAAMRRTWGVFRDRRPDLYGALTTYDGGGA
ncbi:MAG: N-carbamoylputrescine amidase [Gammaproteobacteria bacterium]|nr:N-carbamoylputrescine amidase [Gammaproteobacteria bacterium]